MNPHPDRPVTPLTAGTSSFAEFVAGYAPELTPGRRAPMPVAGGEVPYVVHGTTVLGMVFPGGVVAAGDRRGTQGNLIATRDLRKIYEVDAYTCIGFAGAVGAGVQFIKLFRVELEHYEKMEGSSLSFEAKVNRLGSLLRENYAAAMQGFAHVPLLAGYDPEEGRGRVVTYDIAGAAGEQREYDAIGSGSLFAKSALKKLYRTDFTEAEAVRAAIEALYDAADEDSATAGPDLIRRIYPTISVATAEGVREWPEEEIAAVAAGVVSARHERPNGPTRI